MLRLIRALLPVATLFVGKLIIDEVVSKARAVTVLASSTRRTRASPTR